jgi:hypothetical protein
MRLGVRPRVIVNGHLDEGQRRELTVVKPLSELRSWRSWGALHRKSRSHEMRRVVWVKPMVVGSGHMDGG